MWSHQLRRLTTDTAFVGHTRDALCPTSGRWGGHRQPGHTNLRRAARDRVLAIENVSDERRAVIHEPQVTLTAVLAPQPRPVAVARRPGMRRGGPLDGVNASVRGDVHARRRASMTVTADDLL